MFHFGLIAIGAALGGALGGFFGGRFSKKKAIEHALPGGFKRLAKAWLEEDERFTAEIVAVNAEGEHKVMSIPPWAMDIIAKLHVNEFLEGQNLIVKKLTMGESPMTIEDVQDVANLFVDFYEEVLRIEANNNVAHVVYRARLKSLEAHLKRAAMPLILRGHIMGGLKERLGV